MSSPQLPLSSRIVTDNSDGLLAVSSSATNLEREVNVSFEYRRDAGNFVVRAWGSAFPADGGQYLGRLLRTQAAVDAAVMSCYDSWDRNVLKRKVGSRRPFVDGWDLSSLDTQVVGHTMRALAQAGNTLFQNLFSTGDAGLHEISGRLLAVMRSGPRVVAFHSDELLAPWWLIYTGDPEHAASEWATAGFWGYSHLIEHQFSRVRNSNAIYVDESGPRTSLNVDPRIDRRGRQFVAPVRGLLTERVGACDERTEKLGLAVAMRADDFNDQLMYFGCHGHVVPAGANGFQGELRLSDDEPIRSDDIRAWLVKAPIQSNPAILVNACRGGQIASPFYMTFARELLELGANCLVGPQVDVPIAFATEFAIRLLSEFLKPETRLGPLLQGLVREFMDRYQNPLGLSYSLYRGLDTHFALGPGRKGVRPDP